MTTTAGPGRPVPPTAARGLLGYKEAREEGGTPRAPGRREGLGESSLQTNVPILYVLFKTRVFSNVCCCGLHRFAKTVNILTLSCRDPALFMKPGKANAV